MREAIITSNIINHAVIEKMYHLYSGIDVKRLPHKNAYDFKSFRYETER